MDLKASWTAKRIWGELRKSSFHILMLLCFTLPILLVAIFDYVNIESFPALNTRFFFEETWKGRMFYLFFIWLFFIESIIDWKTITEKKPTNRLRLIVSILLALVPTFYVLTVNFLGLSQATTSFGQGLGLTGEFLSLHWPLGLEYLVMFTFFVASTTLAYAKGGLKMFSISLSLLGGMTAAYMVDTIYPYGVFTPLQLFALPTAASAAAFIQLLGYGTRLFYSTLLSSRLPSLSIMQNGKSYGASVGWPCAGVHSLLLYVLIMSVFFKRSGFSSFRKAIYFIFGLFGTYFVNILRIYSILVIGLNSGQDAATTFHNSFGELYFFTWIFAYILLIICIQRFMIVEKIKRAPSKVRSFFASVKRKFKTQKLPLKT